MSTRSKTEVSKRSKEQENVKKEQEDLRRKEEAARNTLDEALSKKAFSADLNLLLRGLERNQAYVDTLILSHVHINSVQLRILTKSLQENRTCRTLIVTRTRMTDEDGVILASAFVHNKSVSLLDCSWNLFGAKAMLAFGNSISKNTWLRNISFEGNPLIDEHEDISKFLTFFTQLAKSNTLKEVNLGRCSLTAECLEVIFSCMERNRVIISIVLFGNISSMTKELKAILRRNRDEYVALSHLEASENSRMQYADRIGQLCRENEVSIVRRLRLEQCSRWENLRESVKTAQVNIARSKSEFIMTSKLCQESYEARLKQSQKLKRPTKSKKK